MCVVRLVHQRHVGLHERESCLSRRHRIRTDLHQLCGRDLVTSQLPVVVVSPDWLLRHHGRLFCLRQFSLKLRLLSVHLLLYTADVLQRLPVPHAARHRFSIVQPTSTDARRLRVASEVRGTHTARDRFDDGFPHTCSLAAVCAPAVVTPIRMDRIQAELYEGHTRTHAHTMAVARPPEEAILTPFSRCLLLFRCDRTSILACKRAPI